MKKDNNKNIIKKIITAHMSYGYKGMARNNLSAVFMHKTDGASFPDAALAELVSDGMVEKFGENKYREVK